MTVEMKGRVINLEPYIKRLTKKLAKTLDREMRRIGEEMKNEYIDPVTFHIVLHYIVTASLNYLIVAELTRLREHYGDMLVLTIKEVIERLKRGEAVYIGDEMLLVNLEKVPLE